MLTLNGLESTESFLTRVAPFTVIDTFLCHAHKHYDIKQPFELIISCPVACMTRVY